MTLSDLPVTTSAGASIRAGPWTTAKHQSIHLGEMLEIMPYVSGVSVEKRRDAPNTGVAKLQDQ